MYFKPGDKLVRIWSHTTITYTITDVESSWDQEGHLNEIIHYINDEGNAYQKTRPQLEEIMLFYNVKLITNNNISYGKPYVKRHRVIKN